MRTSGELLHILSRALGAALFSLAASTAPATADSLERTNVHVVVKDAESGRPINQAHLTLQFRVPGKKLLKPRLARQYSYSAKTNAHGRYKFTEVPKGTIRLLVTAERHQSFGKEFELEEDNAVIEVTLRKPQPLL